MERHPVFADLVLHSDAELARALGAGVAARETVHEWPLSCVQRLRLDDGRRLVYKSQLPPTVEPAFYARASSPLLPGHQLLGTHGRCATMVLEWIDAPLLRDVAGDEAALAAHGRRVVARIGEIAGELPVYLDAGTPEAWSGVAEGTLDGLRRLIVDGRFGRIGLEQVAHLRAWAASSPVADTIAAGCRVVHGDLTPEQVFVAGDGYRVVDWQRPVVAPPEVDLVALLVGSVSAERRCEPRRHVDPATVGIFWLLRLRWAVEAQTDLFPAFPGPLFDRWAAEAAGHILAPWPSGEAQAGPV